MRLMILTGGLAMVFAQSAFALDASATRQLKSLSPAERLEQRCDMEAMNRIGKEAKTYSPDKVIAYTFAQTKADGNRLKAPGAVFRSKGQWYRLKYQCETGNQHLDVKNFSYQIGDAVPKQSWGKYYLYN
ncbi:DUF930 domain-containing protein [Allorhizobium taibaishanense]|uniref:DUF930 domain-containing protein n=1 Tax=Allorhizobium taibaishanense TaxID=887144 RepID=A0A1Q8ZZZ9_9HYPH|nr:DUF930 domain-containing protein [Allorhizobium taibaishanense]MBB4007223.1 hypothetical protein [Allorhizobium taibaishanense]OLP47769.1 hypothetical protein BJF91_05235 [Allorhizobium taibaishanense]